MCITTISDESKQTLIIVQLMDPKVLRFHENTELLPSGDCYELYTGNNDITKNSTLVLFGIPVSNQLVWGEVANEE